MKHFSRNSLFAAAALFAAGCTSVATFDYEGARGTMIRATTNGGSKSVAVMPFMDQRGAYAGDHRYNDRGSYWLGWIPFVPYGYEVKNSPEKSDGFISLERFHFNPQEDFAAAAVDGAHDLSCGGIHVQAAGLTGIHLAVGLPALVKRVQGNVGAYAPRADQGHHYSARAVLRPEGFEETVEGVL